MDNPVNKNGKTVRKSRIKVKHWQKIMLFLLVYDVFAVTVPYYIALLLRFELRLSQIPRIYLESWMKFAPFYALISVGVFLLLRLYRSIWRFASYSELKNIILSNVICGALNYIITRIFGARMPLSYHIIGILMQVIFAAGIRFSYRFVLMLKRQQRNNKNATRVMLIGAGDAGMTILRDVNKNIESNSRVVCIIDDNTNKYGRYIQ